MFVSNQALLIVSVSFFSFLPRFTASVVVPQADQTCSVLDLKIVRGVKPSILISDPALSVNIRRSSSVSIEECAQSCCDWSECHVAVQEKSACINVHCQSSSDCQFKDFPQGNNTEMVESVRLREAKVSCPNITNSCEEGVENCHENEECISLGPRRRDGCCQCIRGFVQNSAGICIPDAPPPMTNSTIAVTSTTTPAPTTPYIKHLAISISPTVIQLPETNTSITAIVVPDPEEGEKYAYKWAVISYPDGPQGNVADSNEKVVKLSNLLPGNYTVRITVNSSLSFGETLANFTVLPPKRINVPPVAVIRPASQQIHLPNDVSIFDGSPSTDDNGILSYKWELERGPINYQFQPVNAETLKLEGLVEGNYTFKLTVVDADGVSNWTKGELEVIKEVDYPPEANAGDPVVIYLPQNEVTLNGSLSTDDHGIVSWEWTLLTDDSKKGVTGGQAKPFDMQNSKTPYLHLSNLEEGMYLFQLKVTDAAGQSNTAKVDVFVRHSPVTEPRVDAGSDVVITIPVNWAILDGSKSVDETGISKYDWKQLQGPNEATLLNSNRSQANATALTKGTYVFLLTVWNAGGSMSSDNVSVTVVQKDNERPKANAGGDRVVKLPFKWVTLNGSSSTDDLGIESWLWTREPDSLAAGTIVTNSDRTNTLMLTNLVPGRYTFRLTVTDAQGLSDHDIVTLMVHSDPRDVDIVLLTLKSDPRTFTESELTTLRDQIRLLLHQQGNVDLNINIDDIIVDPKTGYVVLPFTTAVKTETGVWRTLHGTEVAALLKRKLRYDPGLMVLPVVDVDTAVCQNNCSGHGSCDQVTRRCLCHTFWMENTLAVLNGAEPNCDWSVLYVIIIVVLLLSVLIAGFWSLIHLCRKGSLPCSQICSRGKRRRPHRYSPLADPGIMRMSTKISNSLLPSDLDESETEESDVVFESKRNGSSKSNGVIVGGQQSHSNGYHQARTNKSSEIEA